MTTATPVSPSEAVLTEALTGLTAAPQKTLSPWLFYDQRGSDLFEQITELPEYYLTRTERSLFHLHSDDILREFLSPGAPAGFTPALDPFTPWPFTIAELGAGTASKTGLLLRAATSLQPSLLYQPIDVSPSALDAAAENLTATIPGLRVHPQVANYVTEPYTLQHPGAPPSLSMGERRPGAPGPALSFSNGPDSRTRDPHDPLSGTKPGAPGPDSRTWDSQDAPRAGTKPGAPGPDSRTWDSQDAPRAGTKPGAPGPDSRTWDSQGLASLGPRPYDPAPRTRVLALYIGSSIGNFSPEDAHTILRRLRTHLQPGDALLLGADLAPSAHKPIRTIVSAYDDAAGVTAAFNLNILHRLNRDLDANFNLDAFAHRIRWNAAQSRIEMHLESLIPQTVHIPTDGGPLRIHFAQGETIHTENSHKFTSASLQTLLTRSGFTPTRIFHDPAQTFALTLAHTL